MAKEDNYVRVWDNVWADSGGDLDGVLTDRGTVEGYRLFRRFIAPNASRVLEAGCGTGRYCNLFGHDYPQCEIVGIDLSDHGLDMAERIRARMGCPNVTFKKASVFSLPFPDGYFDFVFNEGVIQLYTLEGQLTCQSVINEMCRVTRPGGKVLVSVVNWACFPHTLYKWQLKYRGFAYEYGYEKSFTRRELRRLFEDCRLGSITLAGFYPAYGFYRLSRRMARFKRLAHGLGNLVDRFDNSWLSGHFGFEIVAVGTK